MIKSPCKKICKMSPDGKFCIGCGRTIMEITNWIYFNDKEKEGVLDEHPNVYEVVSNYKAAKKASDNVFLMAMKDADPAIPKWKMYAAYYAVVLCGRWSIIPREED